MCDVSCLTCTVGCISSCSQQTHPHPHEQRASPCSSLLPIRPLPQCGASSPPPAAALRRPAPTMGSSRAPSRSWRRRIPSVSTSSRHPTAVRESSPFFFFRVAVNSPSSPPKSIAVIPVTTHKTSKQGEGVFCKIYRGYSAEIWIAAINIDRKEGLFRKICYHRSTRWVGSPAVGTAPLSSPAAARHGLLPRGSSLSCSQVSAAIS